VQAMVDFRDATHLLNTNPAPPEQRLVLRCAGHEHDRMRGPADAK
jgi:hypothetical protein